MAREAIFFILVTTEKGGRSENSATDGDQDQNETAAQEEQTIQEEPKQEAPRKDDDEDDYLPTPKGIRKMKRHMKQQRKSAKYHPRATRTQHWGSLSEAESEAENNRSKMKITRAGHRESPNREWRRGHRTTEKPIRIHTQATQQP